MWKVTKNWASVDSVVLHDGVLLVRGRVLRDLIHVTWSWDQIDEELRRGRADGPAVVYHNALGDLIAALPVDAAVVHASEGDDVDVVFIMPVRDCAWAQPLLFRDTERGPLVRRTLLCNVL